jgi:hypothetical protein
VLQLDHLPLGVSDVDAIRGHLGRLGFTSTANGVCRWTLQERAHTARAISVVFRRGYLDLIEIRDPAWDQHLGSSQLYGNGIASSGVVLSSSSVEESRMTLSAGGVGCDDLYTIHRELPGAHPPVIRYDIFSLRERGLPFAVIEDSAPAAMRTERWLRHPNSATGVRCVHLRVPALQPWLARLAVILGRKPDSNTSARIDLGAASLVVHEEPVDSYLSTVSRLLPQRDRATLLAIEFAVADMDATRSALEQGGIPSLPLSDGIGVEPSAGLGCGLVFAEAGPMPSSIASRSIGTKGAR